MRSPELRGLIHGFGRFGLPGNRRAVDASRRLSDDPEIAVTLITTIIKGTFPGRLITIRPTSLLQAISSVNGTFRPLRNGYGDPGSPPDEGRDCVVQAPHLIGRGAPVSGHRAMPCRVVVRSALGRGDQHQHGSSSQAVCRSGDSKPAVNHRQPRA